MNNNNTPPLGEPHDPPPFNLYPIQVCAKSTVKIDNYDGLHEVLIVPFTVTRTVESWLHFTANNNANNSGNSSGSYRRYGSSYSSYDDRDTEDNNMMESDSDSFFDSSEEDDDEDDNGGNNSDEGGENRMESGSEEDDDHEMNDANNSSSSSNGQHHTQPQDASNNKNTSSTTSSTKTRMKAYWIRELLVETQHGHVKTQVFRATVLYKSDLHWEVALSPSSSSFNNNHSNEQQQQQQQVQEVAIKRMSWECIQASRAHRISEDFIKEIAALQYLSSAINNNNSNINSGSSSDGSSSNNIVENGAKHQQQQQQQQSLSSLKQHHVMTADTIMANQSHVFIVMPYCSGGDIFQRVSQQPNFRFTESQSKYWFRQMLIGLRTLQSCQLCHRDISPENFIIMDDSVTLVIDFGMCLRIPYSTTATTIEDDGEEGSGTLNTTSSITAATTTTRHLIKRQMACGKLPHMAPEIRYQRPFDGYAVDIWSTGTVLLFMLTGKRLDGPPRHPEHFFRLLDLRTEYGVSDDAMDLLRRIFRDRPEDRATLEEIWSHPFLQTL